MPRWFALALCGFGIALLATGLRQSRRGRDTAGWTRTVGRVIDSRVMLESRPPTETEQEERGPPRWGIAIRYGYEARGGRHESEQVWIGSATAAVYLEEARARAWVERFPAGRDVTVWFDPADPRQAVLVPGVPPGQVAVLYVLGAALFGIGFFVLARGLGR